MWKVAAVALVFVAVVAAAYFFAPCADKAPQYIERPETVDVARVMRGPISSEVLSTGEVEPFARVALAPKVGGRLVSLAVGEGERVTQGQLMAQLDRASFDAEVDAARAAVEVAKANVSAAETTADTAGREYDRAQQLFKQGISAQSLLDAAESAWKVSRSNVDVAKATLQQAEAALQQAAIAAGETSLYAPFDSVVARRYLDAGALVGPSQPVLELVSIDTVKIRAALSERYLGKVAVDQTRVAITVDALPGETLPGRVALVSPTLDQATRTVDVEVRVENADHVLRPGMFARVALVTESRPEAVLMPNDALLGRDGSYFVYAVENGKAVRRPVEVGLRNSDEVEITSGLAPGEAVVTSGEGNLFDGAPVEAARARAAGQSAASPEGARAEAGT